MFQPTMKVPPVKMTELITIIEDRKPRYLPPTVRTYGAQTLLRSLGPARAYSHEGTHNDDEFLLFGTNP